MININNRIYIVGLEEETKPTENIENGSIFYEVDTSNEYVFYNEEWYEKKNNSGGSSFPPDWDQIGYNETPDFIINGFEHSKTIYDNWDNTQTVLTQKFLLDEELLFLPYFDSSNVTKMDGMCAWCSNLLYVPPLDTKNVTTFSSTFSDCQKLITVPFLNAEKVTTFSNMFSDCKNLSNESLDNILKMCISATTYSSTKSLVYLGFNNTNQPKTVIETLPSYQDFLDAGWSIGY